MFVNTHVRTIIYVAIVTVCLFVAFKIFEIRKISETSSIYVLNTPCTPISAKDKLGMQLQTLAKNILKVQQDFEASSHHSYSLGYQFERVNDILKLLDKDTVVKPKIPAPSSKARKQEVCPEIFAGKDSKYGAPYFRLGFARLKCENFVPIHKLISLLMYVPHEYTKPAMSYDEMMTSISNDYPGVTVVLATEKELPKERMEKISTLKINFKNEVIKGTKGNMWEKLLEQVETPYVLIAPYVTHFDDDIDLYRLVRVLSYRDDVVVAGGSYRNLTGHWDLGCRQVSFNYWTAKYTAGYYRSFNECVVCDYLPGPFAAKTEWLRSLKFDTSLSEGIFHDLFWRYKNQHVKTDLAVVCADIMFNIDTPHISNEALVNFVNKHDIKKLVTSDGTARWYGCRRGLSYTNKTVCTWGDGIGVPPCDLWNLGEVVRFVMQACEETKVICEYVAGDIVGAVHFGSTQVWGKNAEIYFHTKNFTAFNKLRPKFENVGFTFQSEQTGLGRFTISTRNWHIIMQGRESLEVDQMVTQSELPTRIRMSGAWVRVPRNPGLFARGHFLAQFFSSAKEHRSPVKCPNPRHSACLDQYPIGGNIQFLDNLP